VISILVKNYKIRLSPTWKIEKGNKKKNISSQKFFFFSDETFNDTEIWCWNIR
jgi:hypothetical protein